MIKRSKKDQINEIRMWSGQSTGERGSGEEPVVTTPNRNRVVSIAKKAEKGSLTCVIGETGLGKTTVGRRAQIEAANTGQKVLFTCAARKLSEMFPKLEIETEMRSLDRQIRETYPFDGNLYSEIFKVLKGKLEPPLDTSEAKVICDEFRAGNPLPWGLFHEYPNTLHIMRNNLRNKLGAVEIREARESSYIDSLKTYDLIIVDSPDFQGAQANKAFEILESIWRIGGPGVIQMLQPGHLSVRPHFFSKGTRIDLEPIKPNLLASYFIEIHGGSWPFTEDGLLEVAGLSMGSPRRFRQQINRLLPERPPRKPIDGPAVLKVAQEEGLISEIIDMKIAPIFRNQNRMKAAHSIVMALQEEKKVLQSDLAERFGGESLVSRILGILETKGIIARKRGARGKALVQRGPKYPL